MIVIDGANDSLLLVRQPDHAATCAALAASWRRPAGIEADMWLRFVEAVRRHDDGWRDMEQLPSLDGDGRPCDFKTIKTSLHVQIWQRGVELASDDAYAALLIALHARWLYTHAEQDNLADKRQAQAFVDQITLRIDELILQLGAATQTQRQVVQPRLLSAARRLLSFFDALSLSMIGALTWFDHSDRLMFADRMAELTIGPQHDLPCDGRLYLDPWPMSVPQVPLATRAMRLGRRSFADENELSESINRAGEIELKWRIVPG